MGDLVTLRCVYCAALPEDLAEYDDCRDRDETTGEWLESRTAACRREEGTLNSENGHFACSECYIKLGMPVRKDGHRWTAP